MLQKTVCDSYEINWDLPVSEILRNQTENNDDSDNKENLETFACHKANVKFLNSVMQLSVVASERNIELLSKRERREFSSINISDYTGSNVY